MHIRQKVAEVSAYPRGSSESWQMKQVILLTKFHPKHLFMVLPDMDKQHYAVR